MMPPGIVAHGFVLPSLSPGGNPIPYIYWDIAVTGPRDLKKANREGKLRGLPSTYRAIYAPAIEPTVQSGIEALDLSALTFLKTFGDCPCSKKKKRNSVRGE